jgi:hypothetical protein
VVVDDNPDLRMARSLIGWGVPHIAGNSRAAETLAEAGLAGAMAVVCALEDDLHTLETALLTRELRADRRTEVRQPARAVRGAGPDRRRARRRRRRGLPRPRPSGQAGGWRDADRHS